MSAIGREAARGAGEGARGKVASAREIPSNEAIAARTGVYPLLMIGGVYRMSFAMGLAVYALPGLPPSISRHRARVKMRRARHALRRTMTQSSADICRADVCPRDHEP